MINIIEVSQDQNNEVREIEGVTYTGSDALEFDELLELLWWDDLHTFIDGNNDLIVYDTNAGRFYYVWEWNQYSFKKPYVKMLELLNSKKPVAFNLVDDIDVIEELKTEWEGA